MSTAIKANDLITNGEKRFQVIATAEQEGRPIAWLKDESTGAHASKFIDDGFEVVREFKRGVKYVPNKDVAGPPDLAEGTSLEVVKVSPNYAYLMYKKEGQPFGWHVWTVKKKFAKNYDRV